MTFLTTIAITFDKIVGLGCKLPKHVLKIMFLMEITRQGHLSLVAFLNPVQKLLFKIFLYFSCCFKIPILVNFYNFIWFTFLYLSRFGSYLIHLVFFFIKRDWLFRLLTFYNILEFSLQLKVVIFGLQKL